MAGLIDRLERLMFGATAEERVDMLTELAARRAEARLIEALDRAFDGAIADTFGSDDESEQQRSGGDGG